MPIVDADRLTHMSAARLRAAGDKLRALAHEYRLDTVRDLA